jgi:hypothetical protein
MLCQSASITLQKEKVLRSKGNKETMFNVIIPLMAAMLAFDAPDAPSAAAAGGRCSMDQPFHARSNDKEGK